LKDLKAQARYRRSFILWNNWREGIHYFPKARTSRQLGVHLQGVENRVKEYAEKLSKAAVLKEVKTAEFDKIFTYIGDKKT